MKISNLLFVCILLSLTLYGQKNDSVRKTLLPKGDTIIYTNHSFQSLPIIEQKFSEYLGVSSCIIEDSKNHYFIPPVLNTTFTVEPGCVNCLNDYKITYDLSSAEPRICYYKKVACDCDATGDSSAQKTNGGRENCNCPEGKTYCYVQVTRLRPSVGKTVGFHVFGYYPYFDSLKLSFGFESKNLELKDQFAASMALPAGTKEEPEKKVAVPEAEVKQTMTDAKKAQLMEENIKFFKQMKNEFMDYKTYLIKYSPDIAIVKSDVDYINRMLDQYCLVMKEFSPQGIIKATEEYLNKFPTEGESAKLVAASKVIIMSYAHQAAGYYGYIIGYSSMKIPVVQMQNEDQFQWKVDYYKGRNVSAARNYYQMIKGGLKIDFSAGFAFNSLLDRKYSIQYELADATDDDVDTKVDAAKIVELNQGKYVVDIALMAHVYPRTGTRVNLGGNTGLVIRNGSNVKYLLGGSVMLGYEQRFIISGGVVGGYVDILDQTYDNLLDTYVTKARLTTISSSIPLVKRWEFGSYFAITYNLGGVTVPVKK